VQKLEGHKSYVRSVAFSPDGRTLLVVIDPDTDLANDTVMRLMDKHSFTQEC
jgi:WD40 repeat protein